MWAKLQEIKRALIMPMFAKGVEVFPVVAAPGIEVMIFHMLEPESAPEQMVKSDNRIKGIKRERVDTDLTYTI